MPIPEKQSLETMLRPPEFTTPLISSGSRAIRDAARHGRGSCVAVLAAVVVVVAAGCGRDDDGLIAGAVARVADRTIETSEYERWFAIAVRGHLTSPAPGGSKGVLVPDEASEVVECLRRADGEGSADDLPSPEQVREACREEYERLNQQVMGFLIHAEALELEAQERGIEVSDEEVRTRFEELKNQLFPTARQYERYLTQSGVISVENALFRLRLTLLSDRIHDDVLSETAQPGPEALAAFTKEFEDAVRDRTICAEEFLVDECGNSPEPAELGADVPRAPVGGAPLEPPPPPSPNGPPPIEGQPSLPPPE